jgi:hypothetical protein
MIVRTDLQQSIPAGAPAGEYSMVFYAGSYPGSIIASDSFPFEKLSGAGLYGVDPGLSVENPGLTESQLLSAYPNPFNPRTGLSLTLPNAADVDLAVYDANGRRISTLMTGWLDAGNHQVTFDGSQVATGVYFARLQAGAYQATLKLLLLK